MNINALITFNFQARLFAKDSFSLQEAIWLRQTPMRCFIWTRSELTKGPGIEWPGNIVHLD